MKKNFVVANAIMLTLILIFDVLYMFGGGLIAKSIASIMFVTSGVINLIYCIKNKTNLKFPIWMIIALTCAMIADIVLVLNFYLGVVIFAIGHIFYFVSYCKLEKINRKDLICGAGIFAFALSVIQFTPFLDFGSSFMKNICCAYAFIISLMVGKALSNLLKEKNPTNKIIVIGSILFFISDFMLMLDKFGSVPGTSYLCLGTYYPGQFILGLSLFIYGSTNSLKEKKDIDNLKVS